LSKKPRLQILGTGNRYPLLAKPPPFQTKIHSRSKPDISAINLTSKNFTGLKVKNRIMLFFKNQTTSSPFLFNTSPSKFLSNVKCGESATKVECEDEASCIVTSEYQDEAVEESTAEKGEPSDDDAESTGITISIRSMHPAPSPKATSSFTQQGTAVRRLRLKSDLNTGPYSLKDS
jgi:hypothetical protein